MKWQPIETAPEDQLLYIKGVNVRGIEEKVIMQKWNGGWVFPGGNGYTYFEPKQWKFIND